MTRPKYENAAHRAREKTYCDCLAIRFKCEMVESPEYSSVDRLCYRDGQLVAAVEAKCLGHDAGKYKQWGGVLLALDKYQALQEYAAEGLKILLCIRLIDGDYYCVIGDKIKIIPQKKNMGRKDRNDLLDVHPVVRIAWPEFISL